MNTISILFCLICSGIFAVFPDMRSDINFTSVFMFISLICLQNQSIETDEYELLEDDKSSLKIDIPYDKKYIDKFRNLEEAEVDGESLKHSMVMDYTPYGNVIMTYNKEKEAFIYYTDHAIPYRFLEAVAQKFAIQFNCKKLVVDTEKEIESLKTQIDEKKEKEEEEEIRKKDEQLDEVSCPEEKKSVFANFKSYNKMSTPGVGTNVREVPDASKQSEPQLLLEKSNTYSCEGKLSHMEILQQVKKDTFDERLKMSYADFKKNMLLDK